MLKDLLTKHELASLSAEDQNRIVELCKEVAQTAWFAGVNHANDVADGVRDASDRKRFLEHFLKGL